MPVFLKDFSPGTVSVSDMFYFTSNLFYLLCFPSLKVFLSAAPLLLNGEGNICDSTVFPDRLFDTDISHRGFKNIPIPLYLGL